MIRVKRLILQMFKFSIVGTSCFAIDYGLMIALTELLNMEYLYSSAVSFTVSVVINYLLSMQFVFQGKEDMHKLLEVTIFVALSILGLGLNLLLMWFVVEKFHISYIHAKIYAGLIVTVYNFFSRKVLLDSAVEEVATKEMGKVRYTEN
ncbi:Putative flippase GtrA (transmembrane translocase of bactoprenol-linked glucose) [Lachnospiraceae bacterium C7]|nr:Putative flippase GtrA (transmembrane translocase of bactoprenol-linked glucose) [Lachnospiraceae bacterium C7]